jgi:peroxidase
MHTLWLREHNRVAEYLYRGVPNKTDEFYYQHARRIVIAEMQHIIYTEYLPVIIGTMLFFTKYRKLNKVDNWNDEYTDLFFTLCILF